MRLTPATAVTAAACAKEAGRISAAVFSILIGLLAVCTFGLFLIIPAFFRNCVYCGHSTFMNSHSSHAPTPLAHQPPSPDARTSAAGTTDARTGGTRPHAPLTSSAGRPLHTSCAATNATRPTAHAGSSDTAYTHRPTILTRRKRACTHYGFNFRGLFVDSLVFLHVVSVVRGGAVFKGRGGDAWLVEPGTPR